ncbi:MAG: 6-phosphogluconolactonase [Simkaniaceae bacterium]|nr:6-phosphogluconolactonase [Simkaniaceae bacterium]MCF7852998.1 6-phosphogluconolactonase [Simkaniaceae bacterium]
MTKEIKVDERRVLKIPGSKEETLQFCTHHFIQCAQEAIQDHGYFYVALSGGSTPKAIYNQLASSDHNLLDYSKVVVFFSDERSVPPTHPDSNYKMAMDNGFSKLPIPSEQIYRMVAEENIAENALLYENEILSILKDRPFDYIMLGMGDDGHTASLFPETDALHETKHLVTANFVPQKQTWRMTFTYPLINRARHIAIYVIGESKADRLAAVLSSKQDSPYPSAHVGTKSHPALWIADASAAGKFHK